tara:strand:- start:195 stop:1373 length:1179 start_codon:yes stop_codon:yes gene_type:complete
MKISVIICAAGTGSRLKSIGDIPKQYLFVNGKTILEHSIDKFLSFDFIERIVITINSAHTNHIKDIREKYNYTDKIIMINGSDTRPKSVFKGLEYLSKFETSHVFIHDAVRPNFSTQLIENLIESARGFHGSIPVIKPSNTIKQFKNKRLETLNRSVIIESQTPQFFKFIEIYNSYKEIKARDNDMEYITDDSQVAELHGLNINTFIDSSNNYKVTVQDDYRRFKMESEDMTYQTRIGIGFDVHKFGDGNNIRLFGIDIPFHKSLQGHSDADVGLHSITDAIYGSIGSEDIGVHFSPKNSKWEDADSQIFLEHSLANLKDFGGKILNIDIVVICEEPNINTFRDPIKENLSMLLAIDKSMIGLKATTTEKLGFTGRKEGIAVQTIINISVKK